MSIRTENDPLPIQHAAQQPIVKFDETVKRIVILEESMRSQHRYNFNHDNGVRALIEDMKMQHKQLLELRQLLTEQSDRIKLLEEQRHNYFTIVPSTSRMANLVEPVEVSAVVDAVEPVVEVVEVDLVVVDVVEPVEVSAVVDVEEVVVVPAVVDAVEPVEVSAVEEVVEVPAVVDAVEPVVEVSAVEEVVEVSAVVDVVEPVVEVSALVDVVEPVVEVPAVVDVVEPVAEIVYTGIDLPDFEVVRPKKMTKILKKKITK